MPGRTRQTGQILVLVAGSLVVLALMVGLVIDGGFAWEKRREAQNAADFAALAGARLVGVALSGAAVHNADVYAALVRVADANGHVIISNLGTAAGPVYVDSSFTSLGAVTNDGGAVPVSARGVRIPAAQTTWRPVFLGLIGITSWTASAGATARTQNGSAGACAFCVLGLAPPGPPFSMQSGQTQVTVINGGVGSNAGLSMQANPTLSSTGTGAAINIYGGTSVCKNCNVSPALTSLPAPIPDPLAFLANPTLPGGASNGPVDAKGPGTVVTLNPSIYQGLTVEANATLKLNPGTYYLTGDVSIQSNGSISGTGVTLVFMGPKTSFLPQSNSTISLVAPPPTTPASAAIPFPGMAIYFARDNTGTLQMQSSSSTSITGTIYAINAAALLDMQSGTTVTTLNSMVVVGSANMQSSSKLTVNYDSSQNVQLPGGPARLVQ